MFEGGRVYKLLKFNFLYLLYCFIRVCIHCSIYVQLADNFLTIAIVILNTKCTYFSGQTICGNTPNFQVELVVFWDKYINCLSITVLIWALWGVIDQDLRIMELALETLYLLLLLFIFQFTVLRASWDTGFALLNFIKWFSGLDWISMLLIWDCKGKSSPIFVCLYHYCSGRRHINKFHKSLRIVIFVHFHKLWTLDLATIHCTPKTLSTR